MASISVTDILMYQRKLTIGYSGFDSVAGLLSRLFPEHEEQSSVNLRRKIKGILWLCHIFYTTSKEIAKTQSGTAPYDRALGRTPTLFPDEENANSHKLK